MTETITSQAVPVRTERGVRHASKVSPSAGGTWRERFADATSEVAVSRYCADLQDSGIGMAAFATRHPWRSVVAAVAVGRLPVLESPLSQGGEAAIIRRALTQRKLVGAPLGSIGLTALEIPADASGYPLGPSKQTLRRKVRAARKRGVTVRAVHDPAERAALLELAHQFETHHPDERHRTQRPDLSFLHHYRLWLGAFSADGRPLLLSITPTDGQWGLLAYFRTLGTGDEFSDSRYLATQALVEALSDRGVRHLVDGRHPIGLPNGLRHFQRMVGFRIVRARVLRASAPGAHSPSAPRAGQGEGSAPSLPSARRADVSVGV